MAVRSSPPQCRGPWPPRPPTCPSSSAGAARGGPLLSICINLLGRRGGYHYQAPAQFQLSDIKLGLPCRMGCVASPDEPGLAFVGLCAFLHSVVAYISHKGPYGALLASNLSHIGLRTLPRAPAPIWFGSRARVATHGNPGRRPLQLHELVGQLLPHGQAAPVTHL